MAPTAVAPGSLVGFRMRNRTAAFLARIVSGRVIEDWRTNVDRDKLQSVIESDLSKWNLATWSWCAVFGATLVATVVFPAVVAAAAAAAAGQLEWLRAWLPAFGILTAIGSAVQHSLRPGDRWRAYGRDRDELRLLLASVLSQGPSDGQEVDALVSEWKRIWSEHLRHLVGAEGADLAS